MVGNIHNFHSLCVHFTSALLTVGVVSYIPAMVARATVGGLNG